LLLQGSLKEFSLPNIFQLVKMSSQTGALTIRREKEWGKIFFRDGLIHYAFSVPQSLPLGERLVNAGAITPAQLKQALAEQKKKPEAGRIGTILLELGFIDREGLEAVVREQIQDAAFNFFSWPDGEFEFTADEVVTDQDILVEMNVENVIMEGCRRIDEWELIFEQLGSLERVPHLSYNDRIEDRGEVTLTAEEWRVLVRIDGRADMNVILRDCGLDRFHGAKVIYSLYASGLVTVSEPAIENIGRGLTIAVRGPIDLYNEIFLNTLTDSNVIKQLRVELIDDKEVEIPVIAGQLLMGPAPGDAAEEAAPRDTAEEAAARPGGEDVIVFTAAASSPESAWGRLGGESSAWVLLANANDVDSLRASRKDLAFVHSLGDAPLVVAAYMSMPGEELTVKQIARALGVGADVPVLPCHLRDRESVFAVARAALELVKG
jgi:hypothetical protein